MMHEYCIIPQFLFKGPFAHVSWKVGESIEESQTEKIAF